MSQTMAVQALTNIVKEDLIHCLNLGYMVKLDDWFGSVTRMALISCNYVTI